MVDIVRLERELDRVLSARPLDTAAAVVVLEEAVAACRRDPQATAGVFVEDELLGELAEVYELAGRTDEALEAMRAAITAGYQGQPDPRCRVAEILMRAGRAEPAHAIFAEVKADTPDDVWLYNNAGLECAAAGDHHRALEWLTEGLALALRAGDPERLVGQLTGLRRDSLAALGHDRDELDARAEVFLAGPAAAPRGVPVDQLPVADLPSAQLPATQLPLALDALQSAGGSGTAPTAAVPGGPFGAGRMRLALSWFPRDEFTAALAAWPQLAQDWGTADYTEYNRRLQRHLAGLAPAIGPGWIAPIHLEPFRAWCARTGHDPATGSARSAYAAELARTRPEELIAWPPPRNAACWCESGRKYKKCCGHPAVLQQVTS